MQYFLYDLYSKRLKDFSLRCFCVFCNDVGFEDDIVISYCLSQLVPEEALAADVDESKLDFFLSAAD